MCSFGLFNLLTFELLLEGIDSKDETLLGEHVEIGRHRRAARFRRLVPRAVASSRVVERFGTASAFARRLIDVNLTKENI